MWWSHLDPVSGPGEANLQHLACHMADPHQHEAPSAWPLLRCWIDADDARPSRDSHLRELEPCLPAIQALLGEPRALPHELDTNEVLRLRRIGDLEPDGLRIGLDVLRLALLVARLHAVTQLELFDRHTASLGGHLGPGHEADARAAACSSNTRTLCGLSGQGRLGLLDEGAFSHVSRFTGGHLDAALADESAPGDHE